MPELLRRFKFVVLSFDKEGHTESFPTAFMRHEVSELVEFPKRGALTLSVETIKRLSPDSLSIPEFKSEIDATIAEKLAKHPRLSEQLQGTWNLVLGNEFHMTNDSYLFKTTSAPDCFPLYEGKMIHQFTASFAKPKYWIIEKEARVNLIKRNESDSGQTLNYQKYRFAYRAIARNTDERTLIGSIIPKNVFYGHSLNATFSNYEPEHLLAITALLNSLTVDFSLRQSVTANLTMFFIYQLSVPRLTASDPWFAPLVNRAAKLICTTPEFDDLAAEVGLGTHANGVTDPAERAVLRAEIDGIVAHLYNLTEDEFKHILSTFPLVKDPVKAAALQAYHDIADGKIVPPRTKPAATQTTAADEVRALIANGESKTIEFKSTARWNMRESKKDAEMEKVILKTIAALLNTDGGDLLIGVEDSGALYSLDADYKVFGPGKQNKDSFELWLTEQFGLYYGKHTSEQLNLQFVTLEGKEICRIRVKQAPAPVYLDLKDNLGEQLWIRTGNKTEKLNAREIVEYVKQKWG